MLTWGLAAVWLDLEGEIGQAIFSAIWSIAARSRTDNAMRPDPIGRGSVLPLLLILFGAVDGAVAFGLLGLFLGPTLLAVGYELIREWHMAQRPEVQPSLTDWPCGAAAALGLPSNHALMPGIRRSPCARPSAPEAAVRAAASISERRRQGTGPRRGGRGVG